MSEDWQAVATEVAGAIADIGFAATLEKPGATTGPAWAPVPGAPVSHTVRVIDEQPRQMFRDGQFAGMSARRVMIGATGVAPAKGDRLQIRGVWHVIEAIYPTAPGGVDVLYECEVTA